jgi:adenosylcobinamide-GDP ribazoletransferase
MFPYILLVFPTVEVFVKVAMVVAASFGEPGNGMAARQVSMTTPASAVKGIVVGLVAFAVLTIAGLLAMSVLQGAPWDIYFVPIAVILVIGMIVSIVVGYMMARTANRVFGMVNGDILGATNEVTRPFLLFFILLGITLVI